MMFQETAGGERIANHAARKQGAEVRVSHRGGRTLPTLLFDEPIALPLFAEEEKTASASTS